jgi:8-oxo-dGTP pyrophosphatase MutT (NUDIX family)
MSQRPDLTVAAIVERAGKFLLVEERAGNAMVFNQPAGHVEHGEDLIAAVIRETMEESAWSFRPEALTGIYFWEHPEKQKSFLRFAFCGQVTTHDPLRRLDRGIARALWLDRAEITARTPRLRSPMVLKCIDDYLAGQRYPMNMVQTLPQVMPVAASGERRPVVSTNASPQLPLIERLF